MTLPQAPTLAENIERLTVPEPNSGCWLCTCTLVNGYGWFEYRGERHRAHVASYLAFVGPIPRGHVVRHKCNTPSCANPEHLVTGTHSDNRQDAVKVGTTRSKGCVSKWQSQQIMTKEQIDLALDMKTDGKSYSYIENQLGIPKSTIHRVLTKGYANG